MRRMYRLCACLAVLMLCGPALAGDAKPYLTGQDLPPQLLPAPPLEGSAGWRAQAAMVLTAQRHLSTGEIAGIRDEQAMRIELMTSMLGADFTRERLPRTFDLLDRVRESAHQVSEADKVFWGTRRPYLADPHIVLYVDRIDQSPSYPSGHTTAAWTLAEVLGLLVPGRRADLYAQADLIAHRRIEAGAHYPVDIEGGRLLAMQLTGYMLASDEFQDDLDAARQEIAGQKP